MSINRLINGESRYQFAVMIRCKCTHRPHSGIRQTSMRLSHSISAGTGNPNTYIRKVRRWSYNDASTASSSSGHFQKSRCKCTQWPHSEIRSWCDWVDRSQSVPGTQTLLSEGFIDEHRLRHQRGIALSLCSHDSLQIFAPVTQRNQTTVRLSRSISIQTGNPKTDIGCGSMIINWCINGKSECTS